MKSKRSTPGKETQKTKTHPKQATAAVEVKPSKNNLLKKVAAEGRPKKLMAEKVIEPSDEKAKPRVEQQVTSLFDEGADPGHMPMDEVLDETDRAQLLQLQEQAAISARAREMNKPEYHADFDGQHCVDCDCVIPKLRLDMGRVRCVDCQGFLEESNALKKRTMG